MDQGVHSRARRGLAAAACVLAAALGLASSATAIDRPPPPTPAAFDRATDRVLDQPAFQVAPSRLLRSTGGTGSSTATGAPFPASRILAIYGAPQLKSTALGELTPEGAAALAVRQSTPYADLGGRPVIPSLDLIGVVATAAPGADGLYRTRQPPALIGEYLQQARAIGGRLMLDIQPGRSPVLNEINALKRWIGKPDVDVAIDPEWNVGPRGIPGQTTGSVTAKDLNAVSRRLQAIVDDRNLPPKVLVIHQFTNGSIRRRARVKQQPGVQVTLNFDGIGSPAAKVAGYESLSTPGLFNGFSLFYELDTPLMTPAAGLAIKPRVNFLLYQ